MGAGFSQVFPPSSTLTESNLPDQSGKVFIVTGGTSGVGLELARILYHGGGTVYITARSSPSAEKAITDIKSTPPPALPSPHLPPKGKLYYLTLELDNLTTIKPAVNTFLSRESSLHVLFNNAGISLLNAETHLTPQGHEAHLATNCLGPFLLTSLLLPTLLSTASSSSSAAGTVRVIWTASIVIDLSAPKGGFDPATDLPPATAPLGHKAVNENYTLSKLGNWYLSAELSRRQGGCLLSLAVNPGNLSTNLLRYSSKWIAWLVAPLLYPARYGAYTELWAGVADEVAAEFRSGSSTTESSALEKSGGYVLPWGRLHAAPRADLLDALRPSASSGGEENGGEGRGGGGKAERFWDWCEERVAEFK